MRLTMSKQIYNYLANHMMYIHHHKLNVIKGYSLDYDSYMGMLSYLNSYITNLESILDNAIISSGAVNPPIMIFGSTAVIKLNDAQMECGIILPNGGHLSRQRPGAQVFAAGTPDADTLLLKTAGEDVFLEAFGECGSIDSIIYDSIFEREQYIFENEKYAV